MMGKRIQEQIQELKNRLNLKKYSISMFLEWVIWLVDDSYLLPENDEFITVFKNDKDKMTMITTHDKDIEKFNQSFDVMTMDGYLINTARKFLDTDGLLSCSFFDNLHKDLRKLLYRLYVSENNENLGKEAVKQYIISYFSKDSLAVSLFEHLDKYTPKEPKLSLYKELYNEGCGYGERLTNENTELDNKTCYFTLACDVLCEIINIADRLLDAYGIDFNDVFKGSPAIEFYSAYKDKKFSKIDDNRQNDAQRSDKLPPELSTSEAMEIWKKAQKAGLVDEQYKWLGTKVLLACFAKEMSDRFNLGKGTNSDGSKRINWKIFENLFGISNLRGALNDIKKTGENPMNINLVNDIFK